MDEKDWMVKFQTEAGQFKWRSVGIVIEKGRVLLNRKSSEQAWALPGGTCELRESSVGTLKREMKEENQQEVTVGRLVWVVESSFPVEGGQYISEIGFYYLMELPVDSPWLVSDGPFKGKEGKETLIYQWFSLDALQSIHLFPTFLRTELSRLPNITTHRIEKEP